MMPSPRPNSVYLVRAYTLAQIPRSATSRTLKPLYAMPCIRSKKWCMESLGHSTRGRRRIKKFANSLTEFRVDVSVTEWMQLKLSQLLVKYLQRVHEADCTVVLLTKREKINTPRNGVCDKQQQTAHPSCVRKTAKKILKPEEGKI